MSRQIKVDHANILMFGGILIVRKLYIHYLKKNVESEIDLNIFLNKGALHLANVFRVVMCYVFRSKMVV